MFKYGFRATNQKNIESAINECAKNGFSVLEIHFSAPQFFPEHFSQASINKIRKLVKKFGITLQTHTEIGQSLIYSNTELRSAAKRVLEQQLSLSKKLGSRCLTIHIGKAPQYHTGENGEVRNEILYPRFYSELFKDSLSHLSQLSTEYIFICIENDQLLEIYQPILQKFLNKGKLFLTWDIMKSFSYKPNTTVKSDQLKFARNNLKFIKNLHISGPRHGGIEGFEKDLKTQLKFFTDTDIPVIIEIVSLKEAVKAKKIIAT